VARIEPPAGLEAIVALPSLGERVLTAHARDEMPAEVPLREAVESISNTANVVLGLERGDFELIGRGLSDVLHQPRRAHLYPESLKLVEAACGYGAIGATISGAGPAVLIWTAFDQTGNVLAAANDALGDTWVFTRTPFSPAGLDVEL
jgi:homoserine kinase